MYPPEDVLAEVGRVTIAGSRMDMELSHLWLLLDPELPDAGKRGASRDERVLVARQRPDVAGIQKLAKELLPPDWSQRVKEVLDSQAQAREQRNGVVHDEWRWLGLVIFSDDRDLVYRRSADAAEYDKFMRLPRAGVKYVAPQSRENLEAVERDLRDATHALRILREDLGVARQRKAWRHR